MLNTSLSLLSFFCFASDGVVAKDDSRVLLVAEDADPETRIVDVIVPYTVLFLNTVSGFSVIVAVLLAVSNRTSVVCTATCCSHPTSTANFPAVGLTNLGFLLLLEGEGLF